MAYADFIKQNSKLTNFMPPRMWTYMEGCNELTKVSLSPLWERNIRKNLKKLYRKHGSLYQHFYGFGSNKALIAVGAGPSFKLNKERLVSLCKWNLPFRLEDQPFILMATNHQFKALLKEEVIPHFVLLTDGGDSAYDQLCKDIPSFARGTILIAPLHGDHKTLKEWSRQGREICFYMGDTDLNKSIFKEIIKKDSAPIAVPQGGNVMNTAWWMGMKTLGSSVFMAVGNDLSFEYTDDYDSRKKAFYADGDYSATITDQRNQAKDSFAWMGFRLRQSPLVGIKERVDLSPVGTSRQMFIYKLWAEMHAIAWSDLAEPFHYYNCSEAGILGIIPKSYESEKFGDINQWTLLDDIIPNRWHTRTLEKATKEFLRARRSVLHQDAPFVTGLAGKVGFAANAALR